MYAWFFFKKERYLCGRPSRRAPRCRHDGEVLLQVKEDCRLPASGLADHGGGGGCSLARPDDLIDLHEEKKLLAVPDFSCIISGTD